MELWSSSAGPSGPDRRWTGARCCCPAQWKREFEEAWGMCQQPGHHAVSPSPAPWAPQLGAQRPPPQPLPSSPTESQPGLHIVDTEVGPSTPTGSKKQTVLTIVGSGRGSSGQESWLVAGGEAACLSPRTAATAGRPGQRRLEGTQPLPPAPAPVCAELFYFDNWRRMDSVPIQSESWLKEAAGENSGTFLVPPDIPPPGRGRGQKKSTLRC